MSEVKSPVEPIKSAVNALNDMQKEAPMNLQSHHSLFSTIIGILMDVLPLIENIIGIHARPASVVTPPAQVIDETPAENQAQ